MEPIKDYFDRYHWKETWKKDIEETHFFWLALDGVMLGLVAYAACLNWGAYSDKQSNSAEGKQSIASVVRADVNRDGKEDIVFNRDGKEEVFYAKDMINKGVWTRKYFNKLGMKKLVELDLQDKVRKAQKEYEKEIAKY